MKKIFVWIIAIIVILFVLAVGGYFGARYYLNKNFSEEYFLMHPTTAKIFGMSSDKIFYKNAEYEFSMIFPATWKNFIVQKNTWKGWLVDSQSEHPDYTGVKLLFINPQTTDTQVYQDIPVLIFTKEQWGLISQEKLSVSAAPIGPAKIGETNDYIFATPPRWYGFTDAIGSQEAVDIVKTFKTF
jgi:hypothetical protein